MAFVKREGYDFTLEQLMREFEPGEKLPAETGGMAPAPVDMSASTPPRPNEAEFPRKPEALSSGERGTDLPKRGNDDFTGNNPWKGCRNQKRQCRRRDRKKSHGQRFLGVAEGGTGGFRPEIEAHIRGRNVSRR